MGPFCPCRACTPWKSWHPWILPGGVLGGQASRSGVKRPIMGDPDGALPGPEPPSSQSPAQVNQGATRPLWTPKMAAGTRWAWPGPLLMLWRPESSLPNSEQHRRQALAPQFMAKLQDKAVTTESGGGCSGWGVVPHSQPRQGTAHLAKQLQSSQQRQEGSSTSLSARLSHVSPRL